MRLAVRIIIKQILNLQFEMDLQENKQSKIYMCSFEVDIVAANILIKFPCSYFVEWRSINNKLISSTKDSPIENNQQSEIIFNKKLEIDTEMIYDANRSLFMKKESLVLLNLISKSRPDQVKLVGRVNVDLAKVANIAIYHDLTQFKLNFCSVEGSILMKFKFISGKDTHLKVEDLDKSSFNQFFPFNINLASPSIKQSSVFVDKYHTENKNSPGIQSYQSENHHPFKVIESENHPPFKVIESENHPPFKVIESIIRNNENKNELEKQYELELLKFNQNMNQAKYLEQKTVKCIIDLQNDNNMLDSREHCISNKPTFKQMLQSHDNWDERNKLKKNTTQSSISQSRKQTHQVEAFKQISHYFGGQLALKEEIIQIRSQKFKFEQDFLSLSLEHMHLKEQNQKLQNELQKRLGNVNKTQDLSKQNDYLKSIISNLSQALQLEKNEIQSFKKNSESKDKSIQEIMEKYKHSINQLENFSLQQQQAQKKIQHFEMAAKEQQKILKEEKQQYKVLNQAYEKLVALSESKQLQLQKLVVLSESKQLQLQTTNAQLKNIQLELTTLHQQFSNQQIQKINQIQEHGQNQPFKQENQEKQALIKMNQSLQFQVQQYVQKLNEEKVKMVNCEDEIMLLEQKIKRFEEWSLKMNANKQSNEQTIEKLQESIQRKDQTISKLDCQLEEQLTKNHEASENIMKYMEKEAKMKETFMDLEEKSKEILNIVHQKDSIEESYSIEIKEKNEIIEHLETQLQEEREINSYLNSRMNEILNLDEHTEERVVEWLKSQNERFQAQIKVLEEEKAEAFEEITQLEELKFNIFSDFNSKSIECLELEDQNHQLVLTIATLQQELHQCQTKNMPIQNHPSTSNIHHQCNSQASQQLISENATKPSQTLQNIHSKIAEILMLENSRPDIFNSIIQKQLDLHESNSQNSEIIQKLLLLSKEFIKFKAQLLKFQSKNSAEKLSFISLLKPCEDSLQDLKKISEKINFCSIF